MRTRIGLIGLAAVSLMACNKPSDYDGDGFTADVDCNDNNADIHPDATETCDGVDNNCDNSIDGADADGAATWYADSDADGFGGSTLSTTQCDTPSGFVDNSDDCDDTNADIHPDGAEICDGADNDCDGLIDDEDDSVDAAGFSSYYADGDSDGYGDAATSVDACDAPSGYTDNADDCDDSNPDLNPDTTWYSDLDSDGYGSTNFSTNSCEQPSGYVDNDGDCDDLNAAISPDATEVCDGDVDNDCDGAADDADDSVDEATYGTYYADGDTDGYGDAANSVTQCTMPSGYTMDATDCDDAEIAVNPGETEVCNDGLDNDCSGDAPECALPPAGGPAEASASVVGGSNAQDFGYTDMTLGDFDGDGITDLAVSDYYSANSAGSYGAGAVDFYYGPLSALDTASGGRIEGSNSYDYFGYDIANAGDIDGDGIDDLIVGAPFADPNSYSSGMVYLFNGTTSVLDADTYAIDSLAGEGSYQYLGMGVANLGDIDGSGSDSIAWGAYGTNEDSSGNYVGSYAGTLGIGNGAGTVSTSISGSYQYDYIGYYDRTDGMGDMDGDGYDDWAASGASSYSSSTSYGGKIWVFYGATSVSWTSVMDADATLSGASSEYLGFKISGGGDVDGDGYNDLVSNNRNDVQVFAGGASRLADGDTSSVSITDSSQSYPYFYYSETDIGDLNNDGTGDLVVGDYYGASNAGATWTFYGPLSAGAYDVTSADSTLTGDGTYTYFGRTNLTGDVSGDGVDDLMVGASGDDAVYIFNGGSM